MNSALSSRAWSAPYPWGTIGHYAARILYGSTWTVMVTLEALAFAAAHGGDPDWLGEAAYRSDWIMPVDAPSCVYVGASGGCGLGVGGFSFLQARPARSRWWYEVGGGWIQQRVTNDALRTVAESSWVLTPVSVVRELHTDLAAPVAARLFAGPGLYFGMHAGHMHPTTRGRDAYRDAPLTQLYPLAYGIGPGARIEGRLIFGRHLSLEGEIVLAPFIVNGQPDVRRDVEPLHEDRGGIPVWRKVTLGIGWDDERALPFKPTLAFFGAELSGRSVDRIGYRGVMLRFDIPLEVTR